jgi:hypothetical protein
MKFIFSNDRCHDKPTGNDKASVKDKANHVHYFRIGQFGHFGSVLIKKSQSLPSINTDLEKQNGNPAS